MNKQKQTRVRQLIGREQTKYSAGGREKRQMRQAPSLPKLKFLEKAKASEGTAPSDS